MARYTVIIVNLSAFLLMSGVGLIVALLPQKIIALFGCVSDVGYLASAFALTFVAFQIPMGRLSDRFGFKPFLVLGYGLCACTGFLYYFSDQPGFIFLGRMCQGVGEVPVWAVAPALLSVLYPGQKGKVMGAYNAAVHCGLTAGSLAGIWCAKMWHGNEVFLVYGLTGCLGVLLIALFVREPSRRRSHALGVTGNESLFRLVFRPGHLIVLAGILLYGTGYGVFISVIPGFLIHARQFDQTAVCLFFSLFYMAISLAQLITGPFSDQYGRKPVMVTGMALAGTGIALFSGLAGPWLLGCLTLSALGLGMFCVSALAFLNASVPETLKGTISGLFYFFWGIGYFTGPLILGKMMTEGVWHSGEWHPGFAWLALLFLIEFAVCGLFLKPLTPANASGNVAGL